MIGTQARFTAAGGRHSLREGDYRWRVRVVGGRLSGYGGDVTTFTLDPALALQKALRPFRDPSLRHSVQHVSQSGVRGVTWNAATASWRATAQAAGRKHHFGLYGTIGEAAEAVAAFRREHMPHSEMDR